MVSEFISTFARLNCLLLLSALKWSKCSGANHHQVEFFDWFFATQFLRSGTSIKTILSLYIKTPPLHFYFWICKKMRRKMTTQRGMHKCDKLMLINALHLSYKNILKEFCWQFFWHVSQLWICFIQLSKIRKKYI